MVLAGLGPSPPSARTSLDHVIAAVQIGREEFSGLLGEIDSIAPDSKIEIGFPPPFGS